MKFTSNPSLPTGVEMSVGEPLTLPIGGNIGAYVYGPGRAVCIQGSGTYSTCQETGWRYATYHDTVGHSRAGSPGIRSN